MAAAVGARRQFSDGGASEAGSAETRDGPVATGRPAGGAKRAKPAETTWTRWSAMQCRAREAEPGSEQHQRGAGRGGTQAGPLWAENEARPRDLAEAAI